MITLHHRSQVSISWEGTSRFTSGGGGRRRGGSGHGAENTEVQVGSGSAAAGQPRARGCGGWGKREKEGKVENQKAIMGRCLVRVEGGGECIVVAL